MKRFAVVGLLALCLAAGIVWMGNKPVVTSLDSQTPSSGRDLGFEYWSSRPVKSITGDMAAQAASGWVKGFTDTMKVAGGGKDTSEVFQTHLGPYGLRMPAVGWSFKATGTSPDTTAGVLILQAAVMGSGDLDKSNRWITIARLDSIYGATTVTTERFQYVFLGGAATFTAGENDSLALRHKRFAGLPPDTLTAYSHARFVYHGRYANLSAGTDTLRIVIRPIREYNVTNTREYNKAR